jgi:hypothetical protein
MLQSPFDRKDAETIPPACGRSLWFSLSAVARAGDSQVTKVARVSIRGPISIFFRLAGIQSTHRAGRVIQGRRRSPFQAFRGHPVVDMARHLRREQGVAHEWPYMPAMPRIWSRSRR